MYYHNHILASNQEDEDFCVNDVMGKAKLVVFNISLRKSLEIVLQETLRLLPFVQYDYAAAVEGACVKYSRISALTRSISTR